MKWKKKLCQFSCFNQLKVHMRTINFIGIRHLHHIVDISAFFPYFVTLNHAKGQLWTSISRNTLKVPRISRDDVSDDDIVSFLITHFLDTWSSLKCLYPVNELTGIVNCIIWKSIRLCCLFRNNHSKKSLFFVSFKQTQFSSTNLKSLSVLTNYFSYHRWNTRRNISNTRKSLSSGYPNTEKCVEKRGRRSSFLTTSRCLDILMSDETLFRVFDIASQTN